MPKHQKIAVVFIFYFSCANFSMAGDTISIKEAVEKGMIRVDSRSTGGHSLECIEMGIENIFGSEIILSVEAGRTLISEDSSLQDIVITKQYDFLLSKTEIASLKIYGMCMKARKKSPYREAKFKIGKMADSLLVELARFIDKFNFRNTASQNAVWVLSDGNPLESIHSEGKDEIAKKLIILMHKLTKKAIPWYTLEYAKDSLILFTGKADKLHGNYEYFVGNNGRVSLGIYREDGHVQTILFSQKPHSPGNYDFPFKLDVSSWKKGVYFLKFFSDEQVIEKRTIVL